MIKAFSSLNNERATRNARQPKSVSFALIDKQAKSIEPLSSPLPFRVVARAVIKTRNLLHTCHLSMSGFPVIIRILHHKVSLDRNKTEAKIPDKKNPPYVLDTTGLMIEPKARSKSVSTDQYSAFQNDTERFCKSQETKAYIFIGIEISEAYVAMAEKRLNELGELI